MKSRFTLVIAALIALNLAACGKSEEPAKVTTVVVKDGYSATLAEGIQFATKPNYPSFIKSVAGMSAYEPSGRWTDGKNVVFSFTQKLPSAFKLELDMDGAFGPNAGQMIQISVGDWKQQFAIGGQPNASTHKFDVKTSTPSDTIEFVIPNPKSPKEMGMSDDTRQLGIMFKRLSIAAN